MTLKTYDDLVQGTPEWLELRRGIVTASTVGQLVTAKTIKPAANDVSRGLHATLVAERITGWVEPTYQSVDMIRGALDEPIARGVYAEHYASVIECGFMVEDRWGFRIGYSPDGLVGDDGLIEIKSRKPRVQLATVLDGHVPAANMAQIQCGLLVSGRAWCDYVSFCGGMPMWVTRVERDERWTDAIYDAVHDFEEVAANMTARYEAAVNGLPATERIDYDMEVTI